MRLLLCLRLAAVVAFLMMVSVSCEHPPLVQENASVSVKECFAPDVAIHQDGQVTWIGDGHITALVFKKQPSPFAQGSFTLLDQSPVSSGPVNDQAKACVAKNGSCSYPYTVAESSGCTKDPIVIVTR